MIFIATANMDFYGNGEGIDARNCTGVSLGQHKSIGSAANVLCFKQMLLVLIKKGQNL